ncbi:hypothetical protein [Xanthomonas cerealis]|uniref:hypothetical protein n=1 Tax=Xanthomonas cerealis TaxID=3390025 RepID=UPI00163D0215|nr:hypothetical protein [Xanthomonas translucens]
MSDSYNIDRRPPCWTAGEPCPNQCAQAHARHIIDNHVDLHGPWTGWRLAGRDLVAPSGERIPERRLRGLLWRADATDLRDATRNRNLARKARQQSMVKVVVVDLASWRDRHFGSMAG